MNTLIELTEDPCSTVFLIGVLALIGAKMLGQQENLSRWGLRLSVAAFLAHALLLAFRERPTLSEEWLSVIFRSLLVAGVVLGLSWIFLAVAAFLYRGVVFAVISRIRASAAESRRRIAEQADYHRRQSDEQVRLRQEESRKSWEQDQAKRKTESQRRRTDARSAAALAFTLHSPKLGKRFTKKMLDDYMSRFMGDEHSPDDVERRGRELVAILEKHLAEVQPASEAKSVEDLTGWYQDQKARIESLPVDERVKRTHLANLNERYAELTAKLWKTSSPGTGKEASASADRYDRGSDAGFCDDTLSVQESAGNPMKSLDFSCNSWKL